MTTIITLSRKPEELEKLVANWSEVPQNVKDFLLASDYVSFTWNEMLVYKGNTLIASCTIQGEIVELEDCWTKQGNMWGESK